MSLRRIIVTGGSGRAGQHVINHLKSHGHTVLNVDFAAFPDRSAGINTMKVDLADPILLLPSPGCISFYLPLVWKVFNAINDHITSLSPTLSTLQRYAPDVPIRKEMGEYEAPFCNRKIKEVLGFKEEFDWRDQVPNLDEIRKEVEAMNGGLKA
jgi:hypothetical protein